MSRKVWSFDDVIKQCTNAHNNYYTYLTTKDTFKGTKYPLHIVCPVHGEFYQEARRHMKGQKCKKCSQFKFKTIYDIVDACNKTHNYEYTYNIDEYIDKIVHARIKLNATCKKHGEFAILSDHHIAGQKCPECTKLARFTRQLLKFDEVIALCKDKHNNEYTYNNESMSNALIHKNDFVEAVCNVHGQFNIRLRNHIAGQKCPVCTNDRRKIKIRNTVQHLIKHRLKIKQSWETQIDACKNRHNNEYSYYEEPLNFTSHSVIRINCSKHGDFYRPLHSHKAGARCPSCVAMSFGVSNAERAVYEFVKEYCNDAQQSNRLEIKPKELDIYIPSKNISIEYNGLYWHRNNKHNSLNKLELCDNIHIRLINIFEDEWLTKQDIVKSRILSILNIHQDTIYARKCNIVKLNSSDYKDFFEHNHLQGNVNAMIAYGLVYNGAIVAAMSFCKYRKHLGRIAVDNEYELLRFCNKLNTKVIGGASKLFKHFVKQFKPAKVISYADRRYSVGNLYYALGFSHVKNTKPNYFYVKDFVRHNRYNFAKHKLVEQGFDANLTEDEIMLSRNFYKIYDCGNMLFSIEF
jgi:Zn ribbon nucleic-acid-binding protein